MRELIRRFGGLRFVASLIVFLPFLTLPVLGFAWLWQGSFLLWWLLGTAVAAVGAAFLNWLALAHEKRALDDITTEPGGNWPSEAQRCWNKVTDLAKSTTVTEQPLSDGPGLLKLAQDILELVARHFHPSASDPLLQVTVPHTLMIIERASGELRQLIVENVPGSHWVTLGQLAKAKKWADFYSDNEGWVRAVLSIISPQSIMSRELRGAVLGHLTAYGSERVQRWLLEQYILKVGYHAIELYGGLQRSDGKTLLEAKVSRHESDSAEADHRENLGLEPMRILLLGRANSGKSSLINALFGELRAAADLLPDTTDEIVPYRLDSEDELRALVFDTPGFDGQSAVTNALDAAATNADLILWVTAANRPDRAGERARLDSIREAINKPDRRPPPILFIVSHIDRLRPMREWHPPYQLDPPQGDKAEQIAAAVVAVALDLAVDISQVIPVCLAENQTYNVDDVVWAEMLAAQPEADRVRLLRCMRARRREENWALLRRQLAGAGRLIGSLPNHL